ncbi:MFS transporter [Methanosphaera sp.]|uniref:MFS transporter n=1 Tax=Methanosphaera sp. TaxID=2666342 RepID=UPI002E7A4855|nr:MFS transporter [Methanosphaera sp.]MEE1117823.1 MFS transporter [Methanosphaera sp.]
MYSTEEKYIIATGSLATVIVAFLLNAAPVALPSIAKSFAMNNILQNWVDTIYLLSIAVFSIPCGKICQKYGLNKILKVGIIFFLIGTLGTALSLNASMLLLFRVVLGIGSALLNVSSIALIVEAMPNEKKGPALGIAVAAVYIGIALSPILGGSLIFNFGWQSLFIATFPVILLNYYLSNKIKKEWIHYDNNKFDINGTILYSVGIVLFIYGFTRILEFTGQILTIIGIILLVIFGIWELKSSNPIFEMKLFKNIRFAAANLACLFSYFATFMITYVYNYHLQYIMGMNSQTAGLYLIITPAIMVLMSILSGYLIKKIKGEYLTGTGLIILAVAFILLCTLSNTTPLEIILIAMTLHGIGYGLFSSPNTVLITTSVPEEETSKASASLSAMRLIGQTVSLGIFTTVFAIIMSNVVIEPKYYALLIESCHLISILAVIFVVIGAIISFLGLKGIKD